MHSLVSTAWLAQEIGAADLRVFDATLYLPSRAASMHARSIVPRICRVRASLILTSIADIESTLPHMVPTPARFEHLLASWASSRRHRIVFYDQKGIFSSARGWWLMRLFGHEGVAVLDGGLPKWRAEGRALERRRGAAADTAEIIAPASTPVTCAGWATCWPTSATRSGTGARCAFGGPLLRARTRATRGPARRSYSGQPQSALYRAAHRRSDAAAGRRVARALRRRRRDAPRAP
jgi:hypothetical protein